MPQQDWFAQNAPQVPKAVLSAAPDDWFSSNAPSGGTVRALSEDEIQAALEDSKPRKGFTVAGVGSGLKDIGVGAFEFVKNVSLASPLNPGGPNPTAVRALRDGIVDQVRHDVEGIKGEPSLVAKLGRMAALPVDVIGLPATGIAEDIIRGDYGHAAGLGIGAGAMVKAPQAAARLRGRVVSPPGVLRTAARVPAPEGQPVLQMNAPTGAAVPARVTRVGETRVSGPELPGPDLGPEFAALDPTATPAREAIPTQPLASGADVIGRVQQKLATGEKLGTPELRESFAERQRVEAARANAESGLDVSADELLYREIRDDARANGYGGTDAQLRAEFNKRLASARNLIEDSAADMTDMGPRALLQAIADYGGLRLADDVFSGELASLAEMSKSFVPGGGFHKTTGKPRPSHPMPRMELGGVPSVLRNDGSGLSLDGMVEALRQEKRFEPFIESINDLLEAVDHSTRTAPGLERTQLASALEGAGVRPGSPWWAEADAVSARAVEPLERPGLADPPADWFTQHAPDAAATSDGPGGPPRLPGHEAGFGGNGGSPPAGEIPPQQPLRRSALADEQFIAKLPDELQPALRQVWKDYAGFEDQRRGVQPLARTQALADRTNLPDSVEPGTAFNAEQVTSAYDSLIAKEREFQQLAPKVADSTATDGEWLRHRELETERVLAAERVRGAVAESGRAMRAIRAKVEELRAVQIAQHSNDPAVMAETRAAIARGTIRNYFRNYVYGNLVSGVATQERNFAGNFLQFTNDVLADVATGKPREAGAMVVGAMVGLPRGLKEFVHVMKHGGNAEAGPGKVPITREMPGGMLNPWNDVLRMLSATDRLFRATSNRAEITRRAWIEAGKGPNRIDRASRLIAEHPEWMADAEDISTNRLFQSRDGKVTNAAIALRDAIPGGFLVAPFVRISANLVRMGVATSPAPYVMQLTNKLAHTDFQFGKDLAAPGRRGELARARAAYGSMMLAALTPYALSGNVTGDGPKDAGQRALWLQTHQPNSIKIGDRWVSLQTWPGVGLTLQALANGVETARDLQASGQDVDGVSLAGNILARTVNSITSQSFLHGIEDFQNAIADPARYAGRAVSNTVGALQPLVGAQRTVTHSLDSTVRIPQGIGETLKANTPGFSQSVPPLLDPFGETVQRQQSPLTVGVLKTMKPSTDPLTLQLQSDRASMPRPHGRLDVDGDGLMDKLTRQEETELAQARGRAVRDVLEKLMLGPDGQPSRRWLSMPVPERLEMIRNVKAGATRRVNDAAKQEIHSMRDALIKALGGGR